MIQTTEHLDIQGVELGETVRWNRRAESSPIMAIAGVAMHSDEATIIDLTTAAGCLGWRLDGIDRSRDGACCVRLRRPRCD